MPKVDTPPIVTGVSAGHEWADASTSDLTRTFTEIEALGVEYVRFVVDWSVVEKVEGTMDWTVPDRIIAGATAAGLRVLACLAYTPEWARAGDGDPGSAQTRPIGTTGFAAFCWAAASRYKAQIHDWEIWNEPNLGQFWLPRADPAQYAELVVMASTAIRAVQPAANVIAGALAMSGDDGPNMGVRRFLAGCFANSHFTAAFRTLSLHPYAYPFGFRGRDEWAHKQVRYARAAMIGQGLARRPVWLTEFGAPTSATERGVTEEAQGRIIAEGFSMAERCDWITGAFTYKDRDYPVAGSLDESSFGLLKANFGRKAGWATVAAAVASARV